MKYFFLLLFLAQYSQAESRTLSTYLLRSPDALVLKKIVELYEVEDRRGNDFEVIVPADEAALLNAIAPQAELLIADNAQAIRQKLESFKLSTFISENRYHNYAEVRQWMQDLETNHPNLVKIVRYGTSQQQKPLLALQISKDVAQAKGPALMITAATHGDELITVEVTMNLVNQMLEGYGKDSRFTQMIDSHNLFIVPVLNPDGFVNRDRYDNGRDPNRSYPFPDRPTNTPTASINGIMQLFASQTILGSIDFHAYGEMIMYPWAYTHSPVDPESGRRFHELTKSMAESNGYAFGPISDVIYVAPGSSADYYFWQKKSISLGIEMGQTKVPNPNEFPEYFSALSESTWRFIESFR